MKTDKMKDVLILKISEQNFGCMPNEINVALKQKESRISSRLFVVLRGI